MGKKHLWELEFWANNRGERPAAAAMEQIQHGNQKLYGFLRKKIFRYFEWEIGAMFRAGYIVNLKNGLFEYKITAQKNEVRMLGVIEYPTNSTPLFCCFHLLIKKRQKLPQKDINVALGRLRERKGQKKLT